MDDQPQIWSNLRDLEIRLRSLEAQVAVLAAVNLAAQARSNYLPGWIIAIIGILVSVVAVTASLWATGRTP